MPVWLGYSTAADACQLSLLVGLYQVHKSCILTCRATTHTDLELRARELGIPVKVIHNASIMNAVGVCGLQLYRFGEVNVCLSSHILRCDSVTCSCASRRWQQEPGGILALPLLLGVSSKRNRAPTVAAANAQAISLVFFTDTWRPDSFYSRVAANRSRGLHTLALLDIKVREPSLESLARGKPVYEPARSGPADIPASASAVSYDSASKRKSLSVCAVLSTAWFCVHRFMTVNTALQQLLEIEADCKGGAYSEDTMCVGLARVGADEQKVRLWQCRHIAHSIADHAMSPDADLLHVHHMQELAETWR